MCQDCPLQLSSYHVSSINDLEMEDRKKTEIAPKDKHLFDNLGDEFASAEEKYFFEKMTFYRQLTRSPTG